MRGVREAAGGGLAGLLLVAGVVVTRPAVPAVAPLRAGAAVLAASAASPVPALPSAGASPACGPSPVPAAEAPTASERAAAIRAMKALVGGLPPYPGAVALPGAGGASSGGPVPAGGPIPPPATGLPDTPETVDVARLWRSAAAPSAVLAWASRQAAARGWRPAGSGRGTGPSPAENWQGVAYAAGTAAGAPQIQISVGAGRIRYDAVEVFPLPRPAGEDIPADATAVTVTFCAGIPGRAVLRAQVTAPSRIGALVRAVNALPVAPGGVVNCAAGFGDALRLDFHLPHGAGRTVTADPACGLVTVGPGAWPVLSGELQAAAAAAVGRTPPPAALGAPPPGPAAP